MNNSNTPGTQIIGALLNEIAESKKNLIEINKKIDQELEKSKNNPDNKQK